MDANGLKFWMLNSAADWLPAGGSNVLQYCAHNGRLQLRSQRLGPPPVESLPAASALIETAPMSRDVFGGYARWDAAAGHVVAGGSGAGEVTIYTPPAGQAVTDLAMGYDGVLYLAVAGTLVLVDRRNRWPDFTLAVADFSFWRLIALPDGGVLALDRTAPQLGAVAGLPLQIEPTDAPNLGILRPVEPNPNPPHIVWRYQLPKTETFVAFVAMAAGRICLLSWVVGIKSALLRLYDQTTGLSTPWTLTETVFPYAVAWLGDRRLAILATGLNEALIYDLDGAPANLTAAGDTYVLAGTNSGPFVHGFESTRYYARGRAMFPLLPVSLNSLAAAGTTTAPKIIDSGSPQTIWHRLFLEAVLPPHCGIVVSLAASNTAGEAANPVAWYPHAFGAVDSASLPADTASAVWLSAPSEVPFAQPLLGDAPIKGRQGLFMVLVQRPGVAVRSLTGRYLTIRVALTGDRRSTPEIAALRVYASRFSYVGHYLPELYREHKFGSDAEAHGMSTRRDFFERFVNMFETQLTRIEDRIAKSYLLTRPESTPDGALDWLGSWVGLDPAGYPPTRRRARLRAAMSLHRQRGTVGGITEALDIATDGLCRRGAVLVVENFRLRHIFATILGADLSDKNDPLLPGYSGSSNSFVGDTLFLGDPRNPDFLALFASTMELPSEQAQVARFLDTLAARITVFIHNQVEPVDVGLVQRIVEYEKPAHVAATIRIAPQPFMVGLASLLGVESYLAPEPPPDPIVVDKSQVGRHALVQHLPSLDPRRDDGAGDGA